jgi:uncharacterized protein YxeA
MEGIMNNRDSNGVYKVKSVNNNINNRDNKKDLTSYDILKNLKEPYYITLRKKGLSHKEVLSYIDKKELPV